MDKQLKKNHFCEVTEMIDSKYNWTGWEKFPDPRKGEYLSAPLGCGVYQLRNNTIHDEYVLFGRGKNLAYRMTSLLPAPYCCATRNNQKKRVYVLDHIDDIEYRTIAFLSENEMKRCEKELKSYKIHKFNT